jgi:hypothetical protein
MPPLVLLAIKICVPPVFVALMSLAARRWGPTVGGLILGLPWMTGPVLYLLGLEKGVPYLVSAAGGAVLGAWAIAAFILAFGLASRAGSVVVALAAAIAAYIGVALGVQNVSLPQWTTTVLAVLALYGVYRLLPLPQSAAVPGRLPGWDIPARMAATFMLVCGIVACADLLGPQRSGIVASFPVIMTVIASFTFRQWGRDALLRVLRGVSQSLQAFVGFFFVVVCTSPTLGQTAAYLLAAATAIAITYALMLGARRR